MTSTLRGSRRPRPRAGPSDSSIRIRALEADEVDAVSRLSVADLGEDGWDAEKIGRFLALRENFGWVGGHGDGVAAAMLVGSSEDEDSGEVLAIRMLAEEAESGGAAALVRHLKSTLRVARKTCIEVLVREEDVASQLFYRDLGFEWAATPATTKTGGISLYLLRYQGPPPLQPA